MPSPQSFPKSARLLRSAEFDRVFAQKCSTSDGVLLIYAAESASNELQLEPRLGLVVSRKVGNAVVRNRWKRLVREAFRLQRAELPALDLVVLPRGKGRGAAPPAFEVVASSLAKLTRKLEKKLARKGEP